MGRSWINLTMVVVAISFMTALYFVHFANPSHADDKAQEQSAAGSESAPSTLRAVVDKIVVLFVITAIVLSVVGILLGVSGRAVFYADGKDVIASFLPFVVPIAVSLLFGVIGASLEFGRWWNIISRGVPIVVAIGCIYFLYTKSLSWNSGSKFTALSVTLGKMLMSILCIFTWNQLMRWDKNKSASENWAYRAEVAMWLAAIIGLMKMLINKDRVLAKQQVAVSDENQLIQ